MIVLWCTGFQRPHVQGFWAPIMTRDVILSDSYASDCCYFYSVALCSPLQVSIPLLLFPLIPPYSPSPPASSSSPYGHESWGAIINDAAQVIFKIIKNKLLLNKLYFFPTLSQVPMTMELLKSQVHSVFHTASLRKRLDLIIIL